MAAAAAATAAATSATHCAAAGRRPTRPGAGRPRQRPRTAARAAAWTQRRGRCGHGRAAATPPLRAAAPLPARARAAGGCARRRPPPRPPSPRPVCRRSVGADRRRRAPPLAAGCGDSRRAARNVGRGAALGAGRRWARGGVGTVTRRRRPGEGTAADRSAQCRCQGPPHLPSHPVMAAGLTAVPSRVPSPGNGRVSPLGARRAMQFGCFCAMLADGGPVRVRR